MIHLRTLGVLDLRDSDGRELPAIRAQPKRLALLAYLAVTSSHGFQRRDQILGLFWPELDSDHARAALNRAIYYVRNVVGDGVLLSRGDEEIGLSTQGIWCDAAAFQAALAQGRTGDAVDLYRGDLLEGFFISQSPAFERWLETERERLRDLAHRAAWTFADQQCSAGNYAVAGHWARWAVERSPYDEAGIQRLIVFLDRLGDRAGAVYAYEQFARRIAADLELTPAPETQALIDVVRARKQPAGEARLVAVASERADNNGNESARVESVVTISGDPPLAPLQPAPRVQRWPGVRTATLSTAAALALLATVLVITATRRSALDPHQVVVARFENRTGDPALDRLSELTAQWISQSLTETGLVETVAPAATGEHEAQSCEQTQALRLLAREARAATIVCGALYRDAGALRIHAGVLDALRGAAVWIVPTVLAPIAAPEPALREVRDRVTGAIVALMNPAFASWFPHATAPPTIAAFQEYVRGTTDRDREPKDAAAHMEHAAVLDSMFTWAALEAAQILLAWNPPRSDSLMNTLDALRYRLTPVQVHGLNAMRARQSDNRLAAYDAFSKAAELAPAIFLDDLARITRSLNRPREALDQLDRYEAIRAAEKNFQPSGNLRTQLLHQLHEHRRELAVARRVRRDRPRDLQPLYLEVRARATLGQLRQVRSLIDEALSYPREKNFTAGNVMMIAATEFRAHGQPAAESEFLRRAIEWYNANPDSGDYNLATALYQAGRWDEAEPLFRTLLVTQPVNQPYYLSSLGAIAAHRGDGTGAQHFLDSLKALSFHNGLRAYDGKFQRARIKALLGDADGALQLLRDAAGPQGTDLHAEFDFESLARDSAFKEFTRPKG